MEEGQWVEPGQLLVQLDDSEVRLSYEQRQAELEDLEAQVASEQARFKNDRQALQVEQELVELSEKSLQRYEQLVERNVGSDLSRDEARQQARAQALSLLNRKLAVSDHPNRLQRLQAQLLVQQQVAGKAWQHGVPADTEKQMSFHADLLSFAYTQYPGE